MQNDSRLTPETEKQLDTLCDQISIAHHLDPEIHAELRTHLEDKLRAYLSGEIPLSETDALLLAKSHFGNPATIKSLFHQVHPAHHALSLTRRLAAILAASLLVESLTSTLRIFWDGKILYPVIADLPPSTTPTLFYILYFVGAALFPIIYLLTLWAILRAWRSRSQRGDRQWFERWRPAPIALLIIALVAANTALSVSSTVQSLPNHDYAAAIITRTFPPAPIFSLYYYITITLDALLWLWWCDKTPRRLPAALATLLIWVAQYCLVSLLDTLYVFLKALTQNHTFQPAHELLILPGAILFHIASFNLIPALAAFLLHLFLTRRKRLHPLAN